MFVAQAWQLPVAPEAVTEYHGVDLDECMGDPGPKTQALLLLLGSFLQNLIFPNIDSYILTIWFAPPTFSTFSNTSH